MFIKKEHYNKIKKALTGLDDIQENLVQEVSRLRMKSNYDMQILCNLAQVVAELVTDKKSKEVIATANDGTEITIGHVLNSVNLMPKVEEEFSSAWF